MESGLRIEALESGKSIDKVLVRKDLSGELSKELFARIREYGVLMQRVPVERLNRITMKNHQEWWHWCRRWFITGSTTWCPRFYEEGRNPFIVVLDGLTDTRNFGAIGRTADCAGVDAIVIPERNSVSVTPDAVKTSAGALFYLPVCREHDVPGAVKALKQNGIMVVGATEKGAVDYTEIDYTVPVAVVMGNEETGISDEVLRHCDRLASIPMAGNIGSLNVSVAAGVMIYEAVRQRRADAADTADKI